MIEVAVCADYNVRAGACALLTSIAASTDVRNVHCTIVVDGEETVQFCRNVIPEGLHVDFVIFENKDFVEKNMRVTGPSQHIANCLNFARFYLPELLPTVDWVIYLDTDMIVKEDISELWEEIIPKIVKSEQVFAAVAEGDHFNAGMYITSLRFWRNTQKTQEALNWMCAHKKSTKKRGLFGLGTQPIINKLFPDYYRLDQSWNTRDLGFDPNIPEKRLDSAKILHWNGKRKPWHENGMYKERWNVFDVCQK